MCCQTSPGAVFFPLFFLFSLKHSNLSFPNEERRLPGGPIGQPEPYWAPNRICGPLPVFKKTELFFAYSAFCTTLDHPMRSKVTSSHLFVDFLQHVFHLCGHASIDLCIQTCILNSHREFASPFSFHLLCFGWRVGLAHTTPWVNIVIVTASATPN